MMKNKLNPTGIDTSRFWIVGGVLSVFGVLIFLWMIRIQTSDIADTIRDNAQYYNYVRKTVYPERGNIYDRWGHLLAGNVEVYELGADLRYVDDAQTIAMTLGNVLGLKYDEIFPSLNQEWDKDTPGYVVLSNNVSAEQIKTIKTLMEQMEEQAAKVPEKQRANMPNLNGLIWTAYLQRSYPEHELASNILGFFSYLDRNSGRGYFGIEEKYNQILAGTPVDVVVPQDPYEITEPINIPPGNSLVLTIDREIQAMAEQIIDRAVSNNGAESGTLIISDPRTGEILAMATTPRLDPNEYWTYGEIFTGTTPYNRAVGQTYEPGSVFKVLTMAAGLDNKSIRPDTVFLDTGSIMVGGVPIYNWDRAAHGPQDMIGCMQYSLNVCLAWIATELGPTNFYSYMKNFGIGQKTGIDLAGEVNWPMSIQGDATWYPVNLGTNSFGQGIATTPIQMISAVGALANDGKMMVPHVLRTVLEEDKQYNNPNQIIGQPISAETADTLTEMLAQSLEKESSEATVEGYRVAGKTGTAEIPGPYGYSSDQTNASFVGWGPVDDPRFVIYVWLEKPSSSIWGSVVAAPVFKETVEELVILLDLPPDSIRQQLENGGAAVTETEQQPSTNP
jgi:cell division protein FtsI/penicillin-binding protein 2